MGGKSKIEWTDATWNPWQGCHKVSPGCKLCYMFREKVAYGQEPNVVVRSKPQTFNLPLRLKVQQRVFTCSWSDFFIEEADAWRAAAWEIIRKTPHLTYQILTKRVERVAAHLPWGPQDAPWPHVQIIVSVENQEYADERIPVLLRVNAAVRGVSYEPALGLVDFRMRRSGSVRYTACPRCKGTMSEPVQGGGEPCGLCFDSPEGQGSFAPLDWLIVGGESGPGARPCRASWIRSAVQQCRAASVPCFVKQMGAFVVDRNDAGFTGWDDGAGWPDGTEIEEHIHGYREEYQGAPVRVRLRDRKGGDLAEWPSDLRVREWPNAGVR